jgi:hypothetical protein
MTIEIDGKQIKVEGNIVVNYIDGSTQLFVAEKIDSLYINKDTIKSFYIHKKDK